MRQIYYLLLAGGLLFGMSSCNDKKEKEDTVVETTENANESNTSDQEVALNPPHGEPGHRCEIPVGQPLPNESSSNNTAKANNEQVVLNPPHGQPGHRCEIPVGQPLPNGSNASNTNVPQNVKLNTPLMEKNKGKNLNPPHGEPGHRCEIPVGQPLP